MNRPLRVAFVASDNQGGGRIRSYWPAETLRSRGWDATASTHFPPPGTADILIVHRPLDADKAQPITDHKAAGATVLIDEDDLVHDIPAKFKFRPSEPAKQRHLDAITQADGLTVTTPALADHYGPLARRTWIVPNRLPAHVGQHRYYRSRRDYAVRVGWAGITLTHGHDLEWLAPHATRALAAAVFTTVGDPATPRTLRLSGVPCETYPFQNDPRGLYQHMARADIGIVPLEPSRFNTCKSWLKALEYMTLGKPVVATDLPEQRRLITHGVDGYLASTTEDFADYVQELVHDHRLRQRMGEAARATALAHTIENHHDWEQVIEAAYGSRPCIPMQPVGEIGRTGQTHPQPARIGH